MIDPTKAIVEVENFLLATSQISQTSLRSVLGKADFDQLLSERERLNEELQKIIDESTEPWGVKVTAVEIKDVEIPEQMQRAIARQAEAERERRAKIINSEGEYQAAQKLTDAADIISTNPASLQLRYLQTLLEIGSNQNTTVVFPLPMDVLEPFIGRADHKTGGSKAKAPAPKPPPPPAAEPPPARRAAPRRPPPLTVLSAPEIRIDQLTGLRTILAPGRSERPDQFGSADSERGDQGRQLPLLRGARGQDAARGLRGAARAAASPTRRAGRPGSCRTSTRRWAASRRATAARSGTGGGRPKRAPSPAAATRCSPRGAPASPTSSPRGRRPAPTR